jgi:hypothetical protein
MTEDYIPNIDLFDYIAEINPEALSADGYDDCIIGMCHVFGRPPLIAYDRGKIIKKLMSDGMTVEEAEEYFEYNIAGSWVGENTPVYITVLNGKEI